MQAPTSSESENRRPRAPKEAFLRGMEAQKERVRDQRHERARTANPGALVESDRFASTTP